MKSKKFEEEYFEGWFKGAVGGFTRKDLEISKNWFWGWLKKLNQYIPIEEGRGREVLEIGCSIGGVASLLSERGFQVYASDISKYAVRRAKKISPQINFLTFDVQKNIPIKKKFDMIIAFEVVEHLKDPDKAIRNMYTSLKKGGVLVFSTPYPTKWSKDDPTHINVKFPSEWLNMMGKVGFKDMDYHRFSLLPFFYRFNRALHLVFPFAIPLRYINNPIFYIGRKK